MRLFQPDTRFYDLLKSQADESHNAAVAFHTLLIDYDSVEQHALAVKTIEHDADEIIHKLFNLVDTSFLTPLDKEDLHALSSKLDDITDAIESAASRFVLYHIGEPRSDMQLLSATLVQMTQSVVDAVAGLRDMRRKEPIQAALTTLHTAESEGDMIFRRSLASLFDTPMEMPLTIIKWKDIYERTEKAIDRCEQVATVIESILVKYA